MIPKFLALDVENPPPHNQVTRVGLSTGPGNTGSFDFTPDAIDLVQAEIDHDPKRIIAIHNAPYDYYWLTKYGIRLPEGRIFCTMLGSQFDQPDLPKALGHCAWRLIGPMIPWKHLDGIDMAFYNGMDAETTAMIAPVLWQMLERRGALQHFLDHIVPGSLVLDRMTRYGLRVDRDVLEGFRATETAKLLMQRSEWDTATENLLGHPANPASNKDLNEIFHVKLGFPVYNRTKKAKAPQFDAKATARLKKKHPHPLLDMLEVIRPTQKKVSTYAKDQGIGEDGCIHPSYLPVSKDFRDDKARVLAASGRLTATPNIQNQTKFSKSMFIPHQPGWVLGETDYGQAEDRVIVWKSGNQDMMDAYLRGEDLHEIRAEQYGCDRDTAKTVRYATLYGSGITQIGPMIGQPTYKVKEMLARFEKANPSERVYVDGLVKKARTYHHLQNDFGRVRYFHGFAGSREDSYHARNQALNFIPQSTVADMMWSRFVIIEATIEANGGRMLTQVHDSIVWEAPKSLVIPVASALKEVMERPFPQVAEGFWVPTDCKVGPNWAELEAIAA